MKKAKLVILTILLIQFNFVIIYGKWYKTDYFDVSLSSPMNKYLIGLLIIVFNFGSSFCLKQIKELGLAV